MSTIALAPGHVYGPTLGTGIEWMPTKARLYQNGTIIAEGIHITDSPWEFWYTLAFADTFPQVEHWWFRSAWTGMVRISRPIELMDAITIMGYVQFTDTQTPGQIWSISDHDPLEVAVPFPIHNVEAINLPLRLALARMIFGVLNDDIRADEWYAVTSLVRLEDLAATFPTERKALSTSLPAIRPLTHLVPGQAQYLDVDWDAPDEYQWRLEGLDLPMRTALCTLQGLKTPRGIGISI